MRLHLKKELGPQGALMQQMYFDIPETIKEQS